METILTYKVILIIAVFAVLFIAERLFAAVAQSERKLRLINNTGLWAMTLPLSPLVVLPLTASAAMIELWTRPDWWQGSFGLLLDIMLLDLFLYWMHRAFHEVPFLWRFHEIHHRDENLDSTTAFRFHFAEVALSACFRMIPIIVFNLPLVSVIVFETLVLIAAMFQHSNVKLPRRFEEVVRWGIVTPSHHWVHHHVLRQDTNSNYGTIFSFWDWFFGSRSITLRWQEMPIGLDDARDIPLKNLMVQPFLKRQKDRPDVS